MYTFIKTITEEIAFYRCQNFRLKMEDILGAIEGEKQIHQKQIEENEARIERLWDAMMGVL